MANITIKGGKPERNAVIDDFQNLCQEYSDSAQHEVLALLLANNRRYMQALKDNQALQGKIADLGGQLEAKKQELQEVTDIMTECRMALGLSTGDSIVEAIKQALEASKGKPANSNILQDISEYKGLRNPEFLLDLSKEDLLAPSLAAPSFGEALELATKYKVVRDYVLAKKPNTTDEGVIVFVIEAMHDEIIESKQAQ